MKRAIKMTPVAVERNSLRRVPFQIPPRNVSPARLPAICQWNYFFFSTYKDIKITRLCATFPSLPSHYSVVGSSMPVSRFTASTSPISSTLWLAITAITSSSLSLSGCLIPSTFSRPFLYWFCVVSILSTWSATQ